MLLILIGKSGSGKDAVMHKLTEEQGFERIVSTTTRPMRVGEQEGVNYNYISKEQFLAGIERGDYLEYRSYDTFFNGVADTWYYGSPKMQLDPSKNSIAILDVQGAQDFISYYGKENCCVVEISVPNALREQRARDRGSFSESEWKRRAADDDIKFAPERTASIVDARIDNSKSLEKTILECVKQYKTKVHIKEQQAFEQALHSYITGNMNVDKPFTVGTTPYSLLICGAKELPITINAKTINKVMRPNTRDEKGTIIGKTGHGLTAAQVADAVSSIQNPIMVLKGSRENTLVSVTDISDDSGKPVIIALELERQRRESSFNNISSIYGRMNFTDYIKRNIADNNILAINIKKANEILSAKGIYFPSDKSIVSSNYNISQSNEKVNTPYLDFLTLPEGVIHYDDSIAYTTSSVRYSHQEQKQRVFVDMDGTLARFHDEDRYLERMWEEGFFEQLKPFENAVDTVKALAKDPSVEVYILSAAIEGEPPYCVAQKHAWLDRYLPEIDKSHRIFTAVGENKAELIPHGIKASDVLIDDYNKNLDEWQAYGGHSVKFVNNINHKGLVGELWQGDLIYHDKPVAETIKDLKEQGVGKQCQNPMSRKIMQEQALKL